MPATTLVVSAPALSDEDLKLATGLVPRLKHPPERRHYQQVIADATSHLGELQQIRVVAFGPAFQRAVLLQASADWGEELFSLASSLEQPDG